ncbi:uncharacterized protein LOC132552433 [Ylistrum balloti]|uniref:uncharacterized protein LOC132552433 n=1 Tax=Ylistrum balloti TaxID=509963 RepID=UPI00290589CC|nr:uncharacterized protein LOC132552433 [Ylistrum balloti]
MAMESSVIFLLISMFLISVAAQKPCAERLFDVIDSDNSEDVNITEFELCFSETEKKIITKKEFLKAIADHKFDTCGVDPSFVFKTLSKQKTKMDLEEVFLLDYDINEDKKISLSEFTSEHYKIYFKWMSKNVLSLVGF